MANVYAFRPNRSIKNVDPQVIGNELERIRTEKGEITPAHVVEVATDPGSPLHAGFEWDNDKAAHEHRLNQARKMIVSIRVLNGPTQAPVPAFVSVRTPEKGRNYIPTVEAMSSEELKARCLIDIQNFIESMQRKYGHFRELADVLGRLRQQSA